MESYHILDLKTDLTSNLAIRASNSRKRRRSSYSEINVGPDVKKNQAEGKYLECLHLRISVLEDLFNKASYHADYNPQRTKETMGIGERVAGLEKMNYIYHDFRTTLRDSLGNFCCPTKECDRSYKTAADLHVHIRGKPGNGHDILKRIIDRTYCVRCNLQCNRPRDLQHHEKTSHGEAYNSRIELILGCLTQDAPQESLVDQTQTSAAKSGPIQDLNDLSQVSQRKMSCTEPSVLANSANSATAQPNNNGSHASGASLAGDLIPSVKEDNQSCFPSNNATTPGPVFPFELAPIQGLNTDYIMGETLSNIQASNPSIQDLSFPFDLAPYPQHNIGIDGEDSQAGNSLANDSGFSSPTDLCQENAGFAGDINMVNDFGGHQNFFPFEITPSQQQNIDIISGKSSVVPGKTHVFHADNDEATRSRGSRGVMVQTVNLTSGTFS
ncbi:MAG: hypothetical protein Q9217_006513 [Psora testacea]